MGPTHRSTVARGLSGRAGRAYPRARMLAPLRLALAVSLALGGPALLGCTVSTELRRVRTPSEGVALRYALSPGQSFEGTVRLGNTRAIEGLADPLNQTITCEVSMAMLGTGPTGTEVRATFTNVDLEWDLPPTATYSTAELVELAQERLRGMRVAFVVRPDGRVQALPAPPPDAPPELREVIETMLMGLEAFFVPLPPTPLERGDAWNERFQHETAEGLHVALDHHVQLHSSYRHRDEALVLRQLRVEQSRREQRPGDQGPVTVEREVKALVLFADAGYPTDVDREIREADPEHGVVFRKVRAKWSSSRGVVPELVAPAVNDVQVIRDPCNPDYVGPLSCDEPPAPEPDATAEPEATSTPDATAEPEATSTPDATDPAEPEPDDASASDDAG